MEKFRNFVHETVNIILVMRSFIFNIEKLRWGKLILNLETDIET